MHIGQWEAAPDISKIYKDVRALNLEQNIAEHDAFGFTVVPPDRVAPPDFHTRLRDRILDVHARRTGQRISPEEIKTATLKGNRPLAIHLGLLGEDPIFEEVLLNPVIQTLARYFCGNSVVLSDTLALVKRKDDTPSHRLHVDQSNMPALAALLPQIVNITWTLTEYTRENGPLAIVPSSHRYGRGPAAYEEDFLRADAPVKPIPVECPAGSLVVFGGTTWHAAFPRTAPGLRITHVLTFSRPSIKPMRDFRADTPKEVIDRNPPELARLLGFNSLFPMDKNNEAAPETYESFRAAGRNLWG